MKTNKQNKLNALKTMIPDMNVCIIYYVFVYIYIY